MKLGRADETVIDKQLQMNLRIGMKATRKESATGKERKLRVI